MDGKIAIVTGGTGGIGGAVAALLLEQGARVIITGRNQERLDEACHRLGQDSRLMSVLADPGIEQDASRMVKVAMDTFGRLDAFIANAGSEGTVKPLLELESTEFAEVQTVNIVGTFNSIKHAALAMRNSGGSIVVTGSVASLIGVPGMAAYSASKHAVAGLVKVAALELAPLKIRVNAVAPAPIDNDMMRSIERQVAPADAIANAQAAFAALNPMKRYGRNEEVADAILYLASDRASFINGAILTVDGGFVAA
ncbi:MAG: hypothetical protein RIS85_2107 [Pseudomonadota bacterium]